jgi:ABC-2 type transport system permease protein
MALAISFFFDFCVALLTFYTNYCWGLQTFQEAFISLFSGALIPIAFFPHWLKVITNLLPFQQMSYSPVSIYLGLVKGPQVYEILATQIVWLIIMFVIARLFFSFAIKKVTIQGG